MIDAAIILAGGKGTRLAPWTAPKCLIPINGVSMLHRLLDHLRGHGISDIVLCVGYRGADVAAAVRDRLYVRVSDAGDEATMAGRLMKARVDGNLFGKRLLVLYGDDLADVDLAKLEAAHCEAGVRLTFTACKYRLPFGVVRGGQVHGRDEVLVNIGFVLVDPAAWDYLRPEDGLADWINRIAGHGVAACYEHYGKRATVNDLADWHRAEEVWR